MKKHVLIVSTVIAFAASSLPQASVAAPRGAQQGATPGNPPGFRSAQYRGGQGATWKTGRDSHGFAGSYGGCRYGGIAGPNGYQLKRSC